MSSLKPGLEAEIKKTVEKKYLALEVGSGLVNVFSTAMMIAGMEATAVKAVQPHLDEGQTTVGVHVDVEHKSATPVGMHITFKATLKEISANGKGLVFYVEASDEAGEIGSGMHHRVVVDKEKFEKKAMEKIRLLSGQG